MLATLSRAMVAPAQACWTWKLERQSGSLTPALCSMPCTYAETGLAWSTVVSVPTARCRIAAISRFGLHRTSS